MSLKITYSSKPIGKLSANTVLFVNEKLNVTNLKQYVSKDEFLYIQDLLKNVDIKKNIFVFKVSSKKMIVLVSVKKKLKNIRF